MSEPMGLILPIVGFSDRQSLRNQSRRLRRQKRNKRGARRREKRPNKSPGGDRENVVGNDVIPIMVFLRGGTGKLGDEDRKAETVIQEAQPDRHLVSRRSTPLGLAGYRFRRCVSLVCLPCQTPKMEKRAQPALRASLYPLETYRPMIRYHWGYGKPRLRS